MDMTTSNKETTPRRALGRGLAALIPTVTVATNAGLKNLAIERLRPSRGQPRKHFDEAGLDWSSVPPGLVCD